MGQAKLAPDLVHLGALLRLENGRKLEHGVPVERRGPFEPLEELPHLMKPVQFGIRV